MSLKELVQRNAAEDVIKVGTDIWMIFSKREWYLCDKTQGNALKKVPISGDIDIPILKLIYLLSPTLMGIKPATTVTIIAWKEEKRLNLNTWRKHKREIMDQLHPIKELVLNRKENSELVLFYNPSSLERLLAERDTSTFYQYLGYPLDSLEAFLGDLKKRCKMSGTLPPEIGVVLGIPLKDVKGYMGLTKDSVGIVRGWKMYGNPDKSLKVYRLYKEAQQRTTELIKRMPMTQVIDKLRTEHIGGTI